LIYQWRFADASLIFKEAIPVAERVGGFAQAELYYIQAADDYLMDRLDSAAECLSRALRWDGLPLDVFTAHYLSGVLARERSAWSAVLEATARCRDVTSVANLPHCASAVAMLEVDALLERNASGDLDAASVAASGLSDTTASTGLIGLSDCVELTRARLAARLHTLEARTALRVALDALEENARRLPVDCDRAFARLTSAAREAGEAAIQDRATERSAYYRAVRLASAAKAGAASVPGTPR